MGSNVRAGSSPALGTKKIGNKAPTLVGALLFLLIYYIKILPLQETTEYEKNIINNITYIINYICNSNIKHELVWISKV